MNQNWTAQVERGKALVTQIGDRKWELGDLANEVCPAGANGLHNDDMLGKFATEIGIARSTLHTYRFVAARWPAVARATAQTWTTHRMLADRDDRAAIFQEQVWTYNSLSDRLGRLPNPSRQKDEPVADHHGDRQPVELWAAANAAPVAVPAAPTPDAIADAIRNSPEAAGAAAQALDARADEAKARTKPREPRESTKDERFTDAMIAMRKSDKALREFADVVSGGQWTSEEASAFEPRLKKLSDVIEMIRTGFSSGSWDDELAKLLDAER